MTGSLADAIDTYHGLLTDEIAQASQEQLESQLRARNLYFGDRPVCTVLRPRFLSPEQHRVMRIGVDRVMRAVRTAYEAAMASPAVRAQFALMEWEERLLGCGPRFRNPSPPLG